MSLVRSAPRFLVPSPLHHCMTADRAFQHLFRVWESPFRPPRIFRQLQHVPKGKETGQSDWQFWHIPR